MTIPSVIGNFLVDALGSMVLGLILFVAFFAWLNRRNDAEGDEKDFDPEKKFAGNIRRGTDAELDLDAEAALKAYSHPASGTPPKSKTQSSDDS